MPNALFFEAVIATLFSISKNFLNSSTTINPTRVPKMPDYLGIPGKFFTGIKKKKKKTHCIHTHKNKCSLPSLKEKNRSF